MKKVESFDDNGEIVEDNRGNTVAEISPDRIYLGDILRGKKYFTRIIVRNTGDKPLIFYNVSSNCGCLVLESEKEVVLPGDSTGVKIEVNSSGNGKFMKKVFIHTNAVNSPHRVFITADIMDK